MIRKHDSGLPFDTISNNKNLVFYSPQKQEGGSSKNQKSPSVHQNDFHCSASPSTSESIAPPNKENMNGNTANSNKNEPQSLKPSQEQKEDDIFDTLLKPHPSMCSLLSSRHTQLKVIFEFK